MNVVGADWWILEPAYNDLEDITRGQTREIFQKAFWAIQIWEEADIVFSYVN